MLFLIVFNGCKDLKDTAVPLGPTTMSSTIVEASAYGFGFSAVVNWGIHHDGA